MFYFYPVCTTYCHCSLHHCERNRGLSFSIRSLNQPWACCAESTEAPPDAGNSFQEQGDTGPAVTSAPVPPSSLCSPSRAGQQVQQRASLCNYGLRSIETAWGHFLVIGFIVLSVLDQNMCLGRIALMPHVSFRCSPGGGRLPAAASAMFLCDLRTRFSLKPPHTAH